MTETAKTDRRRSYRSAFYARPLPSYSRGEEIMNMVTHIVGGAFAFLSLVMCVAAAAWHRNLSGVLSGIIYGCSMIVVYVVSSVYHGLDPKASYRGKKVMQVVDHCDIYGLIVGTFAPVVFTGLRRTYPVLGWISFGVTLVTAIVGIVFTAIDFKRYRVVSYASYFIAGWSVLITVYAMYKTFSGVFLALMIVGGAVYTLGMIFFWLELRHKKYCHGVFHLFILAGSIIQFIAIFRYCM